VSGDYNGVLGSQEQEVVRPWLLGSPLPALCMYGGDAGIASMDTSFSCLCTEPPRSLAHLCTVNPDSNLDLTFPPHSYDCHQGGGGEGMHSSELVNLP
jgi:hypothetical protein